jgi:hypothetical protein
MLKDKAIEMEWSDELADYVYYLRRFVREDESETWAKVEEVSGDRIWVEKIARHYGMEAELSELKGGQDE